jgi:hypothetical protein
MLTSAGRAAAARSLRQPLSTSARTGLMSLHTTAPRSSSLEIPELPLDPPSLEAEDAAFTARVQAMDSYFSLPRFSSIKRTYTPASVVSKQGSLPALPLPGALTADKLFRLLSARAAEGKPVHTLGAIDPVQMTQMARWLEVVYVSGWACSSVLTTANNEVGPDLACVFLLHLLPFWVLSFSLPSYCTLPCFLTLTPPQRLSLHHRPQPSAPALPRPTATRPQALRRAAHAHPPSPRKHALRRLPAADHRRCRYGPWRAQRGHEAGQAVCRVGAPLVSSTFAQYVQGN